VWIAAHRLVRGGLALAGALGLWACGDNEGPNVWPIGGESDPQRLSSSFGPRLQGADPVYDFHRGIDVPTPRGTEVYAIQAGVVRRAGHDPDYADMVVQIEHVKEGQSADCASGGCYWSNALHLSEVQVEIGDQVERGQVVGLSGAGDNGFEHLHFEIREAESSLDRCVHPLSFLPHPDTSTPEITLGAIDGADPAEVSVELTVAVPGSAPNLTRVEVITADAAGAPLDQRAFDYAEWNRKYTSAADPALIDSPELEGILISPERFATGTDVYRIGFRFSGLAGAPAPDDLRVTARATDAHGRVVEVSSP
jgi:Peptidase family M23